MYTYIFYTMQLRFKKGFKMLSALRLKASSHLSHFYECSQANRSQTQTQFHFNPNSNPTPTRNGCHLMSLGRATIKHITRTKICFRGYCSCLVYLSLRLSVFLSVRLSVCCWKITTIYTTNATEQQQPHVKCVPLTLSSVKMSSVQLSWVELRRKPAKCSNNCCQL